MGIEAPGFVIADGPEGDTAGAGDASFESTFCSVF